jgi:hypothetical protein
MYTPLGLALAEFLMLPEIVAPTGSIRSFRYRTSGFRAWKTAAPIGLSLCQAGAQQVHQKTPKPGHGHSAPGVGDCSIRWGTA